VKTILLCTKKHLLIPILAMAFSLTITNAHSQPLLKQVASFEASPIQIQVDSLKKEFDKQGFVLLKEANMAMESEYEIPVIVPLKEGTWYKVIFIGEMTSRLYEVRMFDWNEKQVVYQKKMWGDVDGNIINYDYIPRFTEYHMIKPVQVNKKKKQVTGYIMLFKKFIKQEVKN
jgi:hypothetical protein